MDKAYQYKEKGQKSGIYLMFPELMRNQKATLHFNECHYMLIRQVCIDFNVLWRQVADGSPKLLDASLC